MLESLLPARCASADVTRDENVEEVKMHEVDSAHDGDHRRHRDQAYDKDSSSDEDSGGTTRIRCAHQ